MCSTGPYAKRAPVDWARIQKECPNIVRKVRDRNDNYINCGTDDTNDEFYKSPNYFIDADNNKRQTQFEYVYFI